MLTVLCTFRVGDPSVQPTVPAPFEPAVDQA